MCQDCYRPYFWPFCVNSRLRNFGVHFSVRFSVNTPHLKITLNLLLVDKVVERAIPSTTCSPLTCDKVDEVVEMIMPSSSTSTSAYYYEHHAERGARVSTGIIFSHEYPLRMGIC